MSTKAGPLRFQHRARLPLSPPLERGHVLLPRMRLNAAARAAEDPRTCPPREVDPDRRVQSADWIRRRSRFIDSVLQRENDAGGPRFGEGGRDVQPRAASGWIVGGAVGGRT
jgi:hypothetical protein